MSNHPHIVIVGGGAAGIELATRLGRHLGKRKLAKITLVDASPTHLWKPLLHEVAAGTLNATQDELNYFIHASENFYHFQLGELIGINRSKKEILLAPVFNDQHETIMPGRPLSYDILVLAFGSISNDFNVPGVKEHCLFLDDRQQADRFQQVFLQNLLTLQASDKHDYINIVIVGGGATGVELAAELHYTVLQAVTYGLDRIDPQRDIKISLIEAANRILPLLPERISKLANEELKHQGVNVITHETVTAVNKDHLVTASGNKIAANIIVWSVGIKVQTFEDKLDGLALNNRGQIIVHNTLQTTVDDHIFALGDCAACPQGEGKPFVPPRAQASYQQAKLLAKSLKNSIQHKPLLPFVYQDYGSLITLSQSNTIGSLMGKLMRSILIEGKIARLIYLSLYKKHQAVLHGYGWVIIQTLANLLTRKRKPRLKLH